MSYHFFSLPPDSCFSLLLNVWQFDVCTINPFPGMRIDLPRGDSVLPRVGGVSGFYGDALSVNNGSDGPSRESRPDIPL